jgi:HemK-like putative methylase
MGTYYIYLSRMNVIPKTKIPISKAMLLPQKPLLSLINCYHNSHEWSSSSAEIGWLCEHLEEKEREKRQNGEKDKVVEVKRVLSPKEIEKIKGGETEKRKGGDKKKRNQLFIRKLCHLIDVRLYEGKPIQYILGTQYFNEMLLYVAKPILIPRWETAEWCEWLLNKVKDFPIKTILEFGSGSGCISLYLARHLKDVSVYSIDYNEDAIKLSNKNKKFHNLKNVDFFQGDLFSDLTIVGLLEGKVDIIVSNPPYISESDRPGIDHSVIAWEDEKALFSANHGAAHLIRIIEISRKYLNPFVYKTADDKQEVPRIVLEIDGNEAQRNLLSSCASAHGFRVIFYKDTADKMRWVALSNSE